MITGLCEITLQARDVQSLATFYAEALQLEVLSRDDDRIWLAVGNRGRLGLWTPGEKEFGDQGGRHVHFALAVEPGSLDRKAAWLRGHGVEVD